MFTGYASSIVASAERSKVLELFPTPSKHALSLDKMIQRRQDLKKMLVAEKNRLKALRTHCVQDSIEILALQLNEMTLLIEHDAALSAKKKVLKTIPGIGDMIAHELLIWLPELGQLSRREIASLVGVTPRNKDSGSMQGYRRSAHGRAGVKPMLFMAARNSNSPIKVYYNDLLARGKLKRVALVALMRKIIAIANARLKERQPI